MPWAQVVSSIVSGTTFVVRIAEFAYALHGVDKQTQAYLEVANHAHENIKTLERLLRERRELLSSSEKQDYDRVVKDSKEALKVVQLILEPARVDKDADHRIRMSTRAVWVLRDRKVDIEAALHRLNFIHGSLNQSVASLRQVRSREETEQVRTPSCDANSPPPTYDESLLWRKETLARRSQIFSPNPGLGVHVAESGYLDQGSTFSRSLENLVELDGGFVQENKATMFVSGQRELVPPQMPPPPPTIRTETHKPVAASGRRYKSWLDYQADQQA